MNAVWSVDVLGFRVVVEFLVNLLVAGVGGETGEVEGRAWGGGVGHIGGSGADTAGAKTSKEGGAVVLVGDGHLEGSRGGLVVYLRVRETEGVPRRSRAGGKATGGGRKGEETKGDSG